MSKTKKIGLGTRLRDARAKLLLTQFDLSAKSGVSRSTIARAESGALRVVNALTAARLAKALGISLSSYTKGSF